MPLLALGCADNTSPRPSIGQPDAQPPGTVTASASDDPPASTRIHVSGSVATDLDDPMGGRAVVLVDARGERRESLTDEGGAFLFSDVTPPYDLMVAGASRGPTVLLGLRRRDPYIELFERDGSTPTAQS